MVRTAVSRWFVVLSRATAPFSISRSSARCGSSAACLDLVVGFLVQGDGRVSMRRASAVVLDLSAVPRSLDRWSSSSLISADCGSSAVCLDPFLDPSAVPRSSDRWSSSSSISAECGSSTACLGPFLDRSAAVPRSFGPRLPFSISRPGFDLPIVGRLLPSISAECGSSAACLDPFLDRSAAVPRSPDRRPSSSVGLGRVRILGRLSRSLPRSPGPRFPFSISRPGLDLPIVGRLLRRSRPGADPRPPVSIPSSIARPSSLDLPVCGSRSRSLGRVLTFRRCRVISVVGDQRLGRFASHFRP